MKEVSSNQRQTKYCDEIEAVLSRLGHATNAELLFELQKKWPKVSATTIHRASMRLSQRGAIATAPKDSDGSMRYDSNTKPHDHFRCNSCGILRDTDVMNKVVPILEASIGSDCHISGRLTINGLCKLCIDKE